MALRSDWSSRPCPIARSMDFLGDPWTVLVLRELMYGVRRFDELQKQTEASDRTLADRLTRMIEHGLIRREQYAGTSRPKYEYFLTPAGQAAKSVLQSLAAWGQEHTTEPELAQSFKIACPSCNAPTPAATTCAHCGTELTNANTEWARPKLAHEHQAGQIS